MYGTKRVSAPSRSVSRQKKFRKVNPVSQSQVVPAKSVVEIKSVDVNQGTLTGNFSTTPTFILLNAMRLGTDFYQRVGRKIVMKSLRVTGIIVPSGSVATSASYMRMMVVYDKQSNGAAPAITDIITDVNGSGATGTNSYAGKNLNYRDRFVILRDHAMLGPIVSAGGAISTYSIDPAAKDNGYLIDWYIPMDHEVVYRADVGSISDIATGGLYVIFYGSTATASWEFQGRARLRYKDA